MASMDSTHRSMLLMLTLFTYLFYYLMREKASECGGGVAQQKARQSERGPLPFILPLRWCLRPTAVATPEGRKDHVSSGYSRIVRSLTPTMDTILDDAVPIGLPRATAGLEGLKALWYR
jgi:hypothetical protein